MTPLTGPPRGRRCLALAAHSRRCRVSRYLIVAHQTATSPELQTAVRHIVEQDPPAEFTVLVPATPVQHRFTWNDQETLAAARERAADATNLLQRAGARVTRSTTGGRQPLFAIADELREHPGYTNLLIVTLPPGLSAWLNRDLVSQARKRFGLPVTHVIAHRGAPPRVRSRQQHRPHPAVATDADVDALVARLGARDPGDRRSARESLTAIGTPATAALRRALASPDDSVRWEAARVLVDTRDPAAIAALVPALMDDEPGVRWLAAEALAGMGEQAVVPVLRSLLVDSGSVWLREGAHHVLTGLPRASNVRQEVARVIAAIERPDAPVAVLKPADDALRELEGRPLASLGSRT